MFQNILWRALTIAGICLIPVDCFSADSLDHADGTHHFLTRWHDWVLLALVLALIAALIINHYRVKSRKALRESEDRFRALAERSSVGISVVQDGLCRYVNPRFTEMLGWSQAEIVDRIGPADMAHPDDRATVEASMSRRLKGEEEFAHYETRLLTKTGDIKDIEVFCSSMVYQDRPAIIASLLDITDRKKTESELKKTHSDLIQVMDSAPPLLAIDSDFTILMANNSLCVNLDKDYGDVIGKKCYEVWPCSLCHTDNCPMRMILGGQSHANYERQAITGGEHKPVLAATALPYFAVDGSVQGLIASFSDITGLKNREEALRQSEEKTRAMFMSIPVATYIWQKVEDDFVLVDFNDEAMKITGGVLPAFVGKKLSEAFPDRDDWKRDMLRCLKERKTISPETPMTYFYRQTQVTRSLMISYAYVPPDFVMAHTVDITARVKAEEALRESESRFRELAEKTPVGMYLARNGKLIYVNEMVENIFGYSASEILQKASPIEIVHPDDRPEVLKVLDAFARGSLSETRYEIRLFTAAGQMRYLEVFASAITYQNQPTFIGTVLDITERKRAEQALRESEDRFKALAEKSPVGIFVVDDDGLRYVNPRLQEILGYSSDHLLNLPSIFDFIYPDDIPKAQARFYEFMRGPETSATIDFRVVTGKGDIRDLEIYSSKLYLSGRLSQVGSAIDITERKKSQQALKESEDRFKTLAEQSPVGIYVFKGKQFAYANPKAAEIIGYSINEVTSLRDAYGACHPDDRPMVEQAFARFQASDELNTSMEFRVITGGTGVVRHVAVYVSKVIYDGVPAHIGTLLDISDRMAAKEALEESEKKFRALAETTNAAIIIYSEDGMVYNNPAAEVITERTSEELAAMPPWEVCRSDYWDTLKELALQRLSGDTTVRKNYELPIVTKSGREKWCLYSAESIQFGGKPAVLGTAVDITEHRQAEADLRAAHQERYDQVKQIAGGMAHEIYNALFPAATSIDKLKNRVSAGGNGDDDRNAKLLDLAETSVERAIQMTELVTQFSRLESNTGAEELKLTDVFEEILKDSTRFENLGVELKVEIPEKAVIKMNRLHAHSLFTNMVKNALDALEEVDKRELAIKATNTSSGVKVEISDTGAGIPPDILPKLFSPFFSTKPRTGTGLGLAICKRIADIYEGKIMVDSALDRGTTFTILLKG